MLKKFFHYYQIGYNFLPDGASAIFIKKIRINKFIFNGFVYSSDKTELTVSYNYENHYESNDSKITFLILPQNSEYYAKMLQESIIEINNDYEIRKIDKDNIDKFNFLILILSLICKLL